VSETSATTPIADVVQGYFTMWNETDPDRRRQAIATTWSPEASYLDPLFEAGDPRAMERWSWPCTGGSPATGSGAATRSTPTTTASGGARSWSPPTATWSPPASTSRCWRPTGACGR
jgi:hypothetical protein